MSDRFFSFVRARVESDDAAHDVLQSALVKRLEHPGAGDAWFFRVLRNAIIDRHRHAVIEARVLQPEGEPVAEEAARVCQCVHGAIEAVKHGALLREVDLEGQSVNAAALAAGITPNNAAVRLHRARKALRDELRFLCGRCAAEGCLDCRCKTPARRSSASA